MRGNMGLFRGKRKPDSEWVEGNLLYDIENNRAFIAESFEDNAAYLREVDPDTIGECTGLKDKNGKLIFEGDIITCYRFGEKWYESLPVKWDELFGEWHTPKCHSLYQMDGFEYEIIGNIHDNPELLKN